MASAGQAKMESEIKAFQALQKDKQDKQQQYSRLNGQYNENDMVLKELNLLEEDANVYKLVGPVLLTQDLDEARSNVEKRIQYIGDEMKRTQNHVNDLESRMEEKKAKVGAMQQQQQAAKAAAQGKQQQQQVAQ
ncbi:Prefoldin [Baffinella frigidus]|nr:Prefoldin [Cryptophyta sp. CCMP2293]